MVLYDSRRELFWRDLALSDRVESRIQIVLRHAVCTEDVVVRETVDPRAVGICGSVRLSLDRVGDVRRLLDILRRVVLIGILEEMPFAPLQSEGDMPLVTIDNTRIPVLVRREIDIRRLIFVRPVIGLRRLDERMRCLVVDLEIVGLDLTARDLSLEVDLIAFDLLLRGIRHLIVKLVVVLIIALQHYIFIADLVRARMDLGRPVTFDIGRASDVIVVNRDIVFFICII